MSQVKLLNRDEAAMWRTCFSQLPRLDWTQHSISSWKYRQWILTAAKFVRSPPPQIATGFLWIIATRWITNTLLYYRIRTKRTKHSAKDPTGLALERHLLWVTVGEWRNCRSRVAACSTQTPGHNACLGNRHTTLCGELTSPEIKPREIKWPGWKPEAIAIYQYLYLSLEIERSRL